MVLTVPAAPAASAAGSATVSATGSTTGSTTESAPTAAGSAAAPPAAAAALALALADGGIAERVGVHCVVAHGGLLVGAVGHGEVVEERRLLVVDGRRLHGVLVLSSELLRLGVEELVVGILRLLGLLALRLLLDG